VSRRLFALDPDLVLLLRGIRAKYPLDEISAFYDGFVLDGGLAPAAYLSADGRIIWDDDEGGVQGTLGEALAAVAAGARKKTLPELRLLLPPRDDSALDCAECEATGQYDAHGQIRDVGGRRFPVVCPVCCGLGWQSTKISLSASVLEDS